jgi:hypothetical protein
MIDLDDPVALMLAASAAFDRAGIEAAADGGLAVAMYCEPRETRDADLAVAAITATRGRDCLASTGITVVITLDEMRFGGCDLTRLSLVAGGTLNTVDLVAPRSARYATAMLGRRVRGTLRGQELAVVAPEDLVILKVLATRDRDLEDARSVLDKLGDRLDRPLVHHELELLADEVQDHPVRERRTALGL